MYTNHAFRILVSQLRGHQRAPIATLRREFVVAQHVPHERDPQIRRAPIVNAGADEGGGKAGAWRRRYDHAKSTGSLPAVGRGIGERTDNLVEIPERPRPSVS